MGKWSVVKRGPYWIAVDPNCNDSPKDGCREFETQAEAFAYVLESSGSGSES